MTSHPDVNAARKTEPSRSTTVVRRAGFAAVGVIALAYLLTLARSHNEAEDSMQYLTDVRRHGFDIQFVSPHLVFGPVNWCLYRVWRALGYTGTPEVPMQLFNVAAAVASLLLLFAILRRLRIRSAYALGTAGCVAFAFGFWQYAVGCDTYIPPIAFLLGAVLLWLKALREDTRPTTATWIRVGLLHTAACLLAQAYILFLPALVLAPILLLRRNASEPTRDLWRGAAAYMTTVVVLVLSAYWAGGSIKFHHPLGADELITFVRGETAGAWPALSFRSLLMSVVGFARSLAGGHWLMSLPTTKAFLASTFRNYVIVDEPFLVRNLTTWQVVACGLFSAGGIAAVIWLAGRLVFSRRRHADERAVASGRTFVTTFGVIAVLTFAAFVTAWEPQNNEHWIALTPSVFLLLAIACERRSPGGSWFSPLPVLAACLFVSNLLGSVYPATDRNNDFWYVANHGMIKTATSGDLIVSNAGFANAGYLTFFTDADAVDLMFNPTEPAEALASALARAPYERVLVSSWLVRSPFGDTSRRIVPKNNWHAAAIFEQNAASMRLLYEDDLQAVYAISPDDLTAWLASLPRKN